MENDLSAGTGQLSLLEEDPFSDKEKLRILLEAFVGKRSLAEILAENNITERTFYQWKIMFVK